MSGDWLCRDGLKPAGGQALDLVADLLPRATAGGGVTPIAIVGGLARCSLSGGGVIVDVVADRARAGRSVAASATG